MANELQGQQGVILAGGLFVLGIGAWWWWKRRNRRRPPCLNPRGGSGDVDGDGWITLRDAEMVEAYIEDPDANPLDAFAIHRGEVSNVFRFGTLSQGDATWIRAYAQGTVDSFPVCEGDASESP